MPFSSYAKLVHRRTQAPVYGVLYMLLLAGLLCTPMCFNAFVFPVGFLHHHGYTRAYL